MKKVRSEALCLHIFQSLTCNDHFLRMDRKLDERKPTNNKKTIMLNHDKSTALEWSVTDNMVGGTVQEAWVLHWVYERVQF